MEISIIEESKDLITLNIIGENHTLCNILRDELQSMSDVSFASYNLKHPLVSNPVLALKVSKGKPKQAMIEAVNSLKNKTKELRELILKLS